MFGWNLDLGTTQSFGPGWTWAGSQWQLEATSTSNRFWTGSTEYASIAAAVTATKATFSRASQKYAPTLAGLLTSFSSGTLAMTDAGVSLEPAATNIVPDSLVYGAATWTVASVAITTGQSDPTSGTAASLITENLSTALLRSTSALTIVDQATYTVTLIIKKSNFDYLRVSVGSTSTVSNSSRAWFNLNTGVKGTTAVAGTGWTVVSSSQTALTGGYYICSLTFTGTGTALFLSITSASGDGNTSRANAGSGAGIGTAYYLWNSQVEAGAVATSPIVTSGGSATRAADAFLIKPTAGTYSLIYTFDNGSTQTVPSVAISGSGYTIPTSLNRAQITNIRGV